METGRGVPESTALGLNENCAKITGLYYSLIVEQHLVQMVRMEGPTEYLSFILAAILQRAVDGDGRWGSGIDCTPHPTP